MATIEVTEPIFKSIGEALSLAFSMEIRSVSLKSPTDEAIKDLMKQRYGEPPVPISERRINTDGMTELEMRGQCALIRVAVDQIVTQDERFAIHARFGKQLRRSSGVQGLFDLFSSVCVTHHPDAIRSLLWGIYQPGITQAPTESARAFNIRRSKREADFSTRSIEKAYGCSRATLRRDQTMLREKCNQLETSGQNRLEAIFIEGGIVADPNA